jgi:hypothetical protein
VSRAARAAGATFVTPIRRLLAVLAALLMPGVGWAQGATIQPGTRVRVSTCPPAGPTDWITGTWDSLTPRSLFLGQPDGPRAIPRGDIRRLQASQGTASRWLLGAGLGALGGFLLGVLVEAQTCSGSGARPHCVANGYWYFGGAFAGAGGLSGFSVGLGIKKERWIDVPPDALAGGVGTGNRLRMRAVLAF